MTYLFSSRLVPLFAVLVAAIAVVLGGCQKEDADVVSSQPATPISPSPVPPKEFPVLTTSLEKSADTTYIVEPQTADGSVDYRNAVLAMLSEGVTPENNATVPFLQATWPWSFRPGQAVAIGEALQIELPLETGLDGPFDDTTATQVLSWLSEQGFPGEPENAFDGNHALNEARRAPWTTRTFPPMAAWVEQNEKWLDALNLVCDRSQNYCPPPNLLVDANLPMADAKFVHYPRLRTAADGLAVRAMQRIGENQPELAWRDLKTIFFLSRLGSILDPDDWQERNPLRFQAYNCVAALASSGQCGRPLLEEIGKYLAQLPGSSTSAQEVAKVQRYVALDFAQRVLNGQLKHRIAADAGMFEHPIDPNRTLRQINKRYDSLSEQIQSSAEDPEFLLQGKLPIERQLLNGGTFVEFKRIDFAQLTIEQRSELLGDVLVCTVGGSDFGDRLRKTAALDTFASLIQVSLELEIVRSEVGAYPNDLQPCVERLGEKGITDPYSGKPFRYQRKPDGYLLYSVWLDGDNGGDGGEWLTSFVPNPLAPDFGLDLVIRIPAPPFQPYQRIKASGSR